QKECVSRHPAPVPAFEVSPSEFSFHLTISLPSAAVSVYLSAGLISTPCSCERVTDRSFVSLRSCRPPSFTAVITPATCAGQNLPFILLLLDLCQCGMTTGLADSLAYCIIEHCCKLEGGFEWTEIRWSSEQCYRC
ncbi:hypothetical protein IRJ41_018528, partial [Triplophysa rosa]